MAWSGGPRHHGLRRYTDVRACRYSCVHVGTLACGHSTVPPAGTLQCTVYSGTCTYVLEVLEPSLQSLELSEYKPGTCYESLAPSTGNGITNDWVFGHVYLVLICMHEHVSKVVKGGALNDI